MVWAMSAVSDLGLAAAQVPELDDAVADLFDLDVRMHDSAQDELGACSADCTNDGCTAATKC